MTWENEYKSKLLSIEAAAAKIESGDRCWVSCSSDSPVQLLDSIAEQYKTMEDVHMYSALALYPFKFFTSPEYIGHISYHSLFYGPYERAYEKAGNMDLNSIQFSKVGEFLLDRTEKGPQLNTLLADVSLPDDEGYMYFGPMGVATAGPVSEVVGKIIVQVNKYQPKVTGVYNRIHVKDVTWICECDHKLPLFPQPPVTETETKIAEHILPQIPDGATIQIGLGGLANAVGYGLEQKKNLSVHTEMFTDSMLELVKKGVINGKIYSGFGLGSQELINFVGQGHVELAPIWMVNNPYEIGKNDDFISINACLMVDLTGQVCSEGIGHRSYSGTGGQVDYVRGAALSKGGKSFMCLSSTSTDKDNNVRSNIMLNLPPGAAVTTGRTDVMYIVTEFGAAYLYNKSIPERVEALINVAHPDFRNGLREQAKKAGLTK